MTIMQAVLFLCPALKLFRRGVFEMYGIATWLELRDHITM